MNSEAFARSVSLELYDSSSSTVAVSESNEGDAVEGVNMKCTSNPGLTTEEGTTNIGTALTDAIGRRDPEVMAPCNMDGMRTEEVSGGDDDECDAWDANCDRRVDADADEESLTTVNEGF